MMSEVQAILRKYLAVETLFQHGEGLDFMVVVVINRAFSCFKGEIKWRVQRKSWLEGFGPRKVKGKIEIEKDRK